MFLLTKFFRSSQINEGDVTERKKEKERSQAEPPQKCEEQKNPQKTPEAY